MMDVNDMCDALEKALYLEAEGHEFYVKCGQNTKSKEANDMFKYLAKEEERHFKIIEDIFEKNFRKEYDGRIKTCKPPGKIQPTGVFEKNFPGGRVDEKSDALDALNIGIKAEDNSIMLYQKLAKESFQVDTIKLFEKLVEEEKKHKEILSYEVEFVTGTGQFHDFKTVTM
ncbi:MAG: ferritin family protein [Candidatus Altiarchaeota archaeon]|nr:ferritin family protein [Candidatus Altiarchaeota archaeon]